MPNSWPRDELEFHLKTAHHCTAFDDSDSYRELQKTHRFYHRGRSHPRVPKAYRMKLAKSEVILEIACWAQSHANDAGDRPNARTRPFDEWPNDDPERVIARRYGLKGTDLAKIWDQLADEFERRALRTGYEEAWVGLDDFEDDVLPD
jgi:hypothetical protein